MRNHNKWYCQNKNVSKGQIFTCIKNTRYIAEGETVFVAYFLAFDHVFCEAYYCRLL